MFALGRQIDGATQAEELSGEMEMLLKIKGVNDAPVVVNPQDKYVRPEVCEARNEERECHFGQFWAEEDTADTLSIGGMEISDVDLYEQTPDARFAVKVIAKKGTVDFNTR